MARKKKGIGDSRRDKRALFLDDEAAFHRKFGLPQDADGYLVSDWRISGVEPSPLPEARSIATYVERPNPSERELQLKQEIIALRVEVDALRQRGEEGEEIVSVDRLHETLAKLEKLQTREGLWDIFSRVHPDASQVIEGSEQLQANFRDGASKEAFVMSVDIRRSTDLMLLARTPQLYAGFVTGVSDILKEIVLAHHGIFDKFTGDGILAFFPAFYTGENAGLRAVQAAADCHTAFAAHYGRHRSTFKIVPKNVGLGIGIDFGDIHIVRVADGLTVVGNPVVYACRLGDAPAGVTLLNQPAYEVVSSLYHRYCDFTEIEFPIKHGDVVIAYQVKPNDRRFEFGLVAWKAFTLGQPQ